MAAISFQRKLRVNPVVHNQPKDLLSVSFSANKSQLSKCEFWVYVDHPLGGGTAYVLKVSDFIELEKE